MDGHAHLMLIAAMLQLGATEVRISLEMIDEAERHIMLPPRQDGNDTILKIEPRVRQ